MLHIGDVGEIDLSTPVWIAPFVAIVIELGQAPRGPFEKGVLDLITYIPRDEVVSFHSWGEPAAMEDMSAKFPNLWVLHSGSMPLPAIFPEPKLVWDGGFPTSLQHIRLEAPVVDGGNWGPLTTFLSRRAILGNRLDSLTLDRSPHMYLEVEQRIRSMVREFRVTWA